MRDKSRKKPCERVDEPPQKPKLNSKLGIALKTLGKQPINGLRHRPEGETNGWYIWCGNEFSTNQDFFSPLHTRHLEDYLQGLIDYLDLPPGYRFILDSNGYEDIWFDQTLLNP